MTGTGGDTGRGVRVAARGLRTWRRLVDLGIAAAVAAGISTGAWKAWNAATPHEWHVMGVYVLSELLLTAGFHPDKTKTMRGPDGSVHVAAIGSIAGHGPILELRDRILDDVFDAALAGVGIGAAAAVGGLAVLRSRGRSRGRARRRRGAELGTPREPAGRVMPLRHRLLLRAGPAASRPYAVAGIVWPADAETSHTIVSGTTGSGKTVLIADLVQQIRAHGERCVVYDKMGSYTEAFFDKSRDVLLNPLDARTPRWSPFLEARTARDFDTMAAALIPRQKDAADPFWITAARQLFSHGAAVLWKGGETRNRVLVDRLLKTELSELAEAMEGTVAQSIVDPANPKTALSVRAMLTANIGAMDVLPDEGDPFSIREWIERDGEGCLFLTSRGDQHASLRGLISTWLEIAVNALLSLPRADGAGNAPARRIWLILDELPTLHQLPSLKPGLAESRQFGGCFVLGVQVFSALRDLYGRDGAQTISGLCGTRVVLAAPDKDTSEWSAESLGRVEMESLTEGVSYETGGSPRAAPGGGGGRGAGRGAAEHQARPASPCAALRGGASPEPLGIHQVPRPLAGGQDQAQVQGTACGGCTVRPEGGRRRRYGAGAGRRERRRRRRGPHAGGAAPRSVRRGGGKGRRRGPGDGRRSARRLSCGRGRSARERAGLALRGNRPGGGAGRRPEEGAGRRRRRGGGRAAEAAQGEAGRDPDLRWSSSEMVAI